MKVSQNAEEPSINKQSSKEEVNKDRLRILEQK